MCKNRKNDILDCTAYTIHTVISNGIVQLTLRYLYNSHGAARNDVGQKVLPPFVVAKP